MARSTAPYWLLAGLLLAQNVVAQDPTPTKNTDTAAHTPNTGYNGGEDNPIDPTDAGAAGAQKGGFTLSKGGLAAIIVVIALVIIVGSTGSPCQGSNTVTYMPSLLCRPLLARKETPMGRPPVSPSRLSSSHRPLYCRSVCHQTPEPKNGCEAQQPTGTETGYR